MLAAPVAELFRLHPVGMLFLIFCRRVISVFAVVALHGDNFAHRCSPGASLAT
jgi:hypothetical protein